MKELTEKEKWYLKGYADALQQAMYELTGDNTCSKSYDPISFGDGYIASYAFRFKNCGRRHELSEFANSGEIEMLMLNQACEWIRGELKHYIDMIKSNNNKNKNKMKKFTTEEISGLLDRAMIEEISFSEMVEVINEMVSEAEDTPEELKKGDLAIFWDNEKKNCSHKIL